MGRKKMSVHALSERTKQKYSKQQLEEMERQEEYIKNSMTSQLEEYVLKKIKKEDQRQLFYAFKQMLEQLGVYGSVDSFNILNLIDNIEGISNAKKLRDNSLKYGNVEEYVKLEKLILSYQNQINSIFKSLNISADSRHKLQQLTASGALQSNEVSDEDMNKILELLGDE